MKTIKKGRPQKGWAKEIQCTGKGNKGSGCGSTLLVEEGDLFQTSHTDWTGDTDYFVTFKCCECGCLSDIEDSPFFGKNLLTYKEWSRQHYIGASPSDEIIQNS